MPELHKIILSKLGLIIYTIDELLCTKFIKIYGNEVKNNIVAIMLHLESNNINLEDIHHYIFAQYLATKDIDNVLSFYYYVMFDFKNDDILEIKIKELYEKFFKKKY